jgi:hypothetical protein
VTGAHATEQLHHTSKNEESELNLCIEASKTMTPTQPTYDAIDDVLYEWYRWSSGYQEIRSHDSADSTCRDFRVSRQWMDHGELSDLVDYEIRKTTGQLVDPIISTLGLRHRIAVNMAMRNMDCGYSVWKSGARPDTQETDYREAKRIMLPRLIAKNLVNPETMV